MIAMPQPSIVLYAVGLCCCSVCVPIGMPDAEVERQANQIKPPGGTLRWRVSKAKTFATGEPHPCPCPQRLGHEHRLMVC